MTFWRILFAAILFASPAFAQGVPSPLNAPSSSTGGHAICFSTSNSQQTSDCGTAYLQSPGSSIDDTASLQAAASVPGSVTVLAPGDYLFSAPLVFANDASLKCIGNNNAYKLTSNDANSVSICRLLSDVTQPGNFPPNSACVKQGNYSTLEDITVECLHYGATGNTDGSTATITGMSNVTNLAAMWVVSGPGISNSTPATISSVNSGCLPTPCVVLNVTPTANQTGGSFQFSPPVNAVDASVVFSYLHHVNIRYGQYGVYCQTASKVLIDGKSFVSHAVYDGVHIGPGCADSTVDGGNYIFSNGASGIYDHTGTKNTFVGNTLEGNALYGGDFSNASDIVFTGNTLDQEGFGGLSIKTMAGMTVAGNTFRQTYNSGAGGAHINLGNTNSNLQFSGNAYIASNPNSGTITDYVYAVSGTPVLTSSTFAENPPAQNVGIFANAAAQATISPFVGATGQTASRLIASIGASVSAPADTTEDILGTATIPGNALGPNGCVIVNALWTYTNSSNNKILRVEFNTNGSTGGSKYLNTTVTTTATNPTITRICNKGVTSSQQGAPSFGQISPTTGPPITGAIDTTGLTYIVFTGQKASAGEVLTLEQWSVKTEYGP